MQRLGVIGIVLALAVALAACGETKTVIIREQATPTPSLQASSTDKKTHSDTSGGNESVVSDEGTGGQARSGKITVPNEVGKNHQAAQDDLQAHGLYNLSEEDATGQDRMLMSIATGKSFRSHRRPARASTRTPRSRCDPRGTPTDPRGWLAAPPCASRSVRTQRAVCHRQ